jgi:hypothetical protein
VPGLGGVVLGHYKSLALMAAALDAALQEPSDGRDSDQLQIPCHCCPACCQNSVLSKRFGAPGCHVAVGMPHPAPRARLLRTWHANPDCSECHMQFAPVGASHKSALRCARHILQITQNSTRAGMLRSLQCTPAETSTLPVHHRDSCRDGTWRRGFI